MTFEEYMKTTPRTMASLGNPDLDIQHCLYGMITESAEIIDLYKKRLAYNKPLSMEQVEDELGDLFFYISSFMHFAKLNPSDVFRKNFEKLMIRFPEGFSEEKAINPNKVSEMEVFNTVK